jgi:hypothetical protein
MVWSGWGELDGLGGDGGDKGRGEVEFGDKNLAEASINH